MRKSQSLHLVWSWVRVEPEPPHFKLNTHLSSFSITTDLKSDDFPSSALILRTSEADQTSMALHLPLASTAGWRSPAGAHIHYIITPSGRTDDAAWPPIRSQALLVLSMTISCSKIGVVLRSLHGSSTERVFEPERLFIQPEVRVYLIPACPQHETEFTLHETYGVP